MPIESFGSNFEQQEIQPLHKASPEEVKQVGDSIKYSQHLRDVNNVLQVLDFPDNQEEPFRKTLEKQDTETLKELANKSKSEVLVFLANSEENTTEMIENRAQVIEQKEAQKQEIKTDTLQEQYQENDGKFNEIKNILPSGVYTGNPEFKGLVTQLDKYEALTLGADAESNAQINEAKAEILDAIITQLKNPKVFKSVVDELGGADTNNPEYAAFKETLLGIDSSFESYFKDLESIDTGVSLNTDEIIDSIEKDSGGMVDIDLGANISKLSLVGSSYSFDEEIDKQALSEVMGEAKNELAGVQSSFAALQGFIKPFDGLLFSLRENWGKPDLKEQLKASIATFSSDVFKNITDVYENMGIKTEDQITESDIRSFADIDSPEELRHRIQSIQKRLLNLKTKIAEQQAGILKKHKAEIKELLTRESEAKEKQLEVLDFMRSSGFDLIPKEISDKIIRELQSNTLLIPGLEMSIKNIDLKNGHFGESSAFIDQDAGLNIGAKRNMIKFLNKMISGDINEPLSVEAIANGTSVTDPAFLKNKFLEANIVGNMGWKYSNITANLRKQS